MLSSNSNENEAEEEEVANRNSKRLKIEYTTTPSDENKENIMQQLIRRSSCIFGFRKEGQVATAFEANKQGT